MARKFCSGISNSHKGIHFQDPEVRNGRSRTPVYLLVPRGMRTRESDFHRRWSSCDGGLCGTGPQIGTTDAKCSSRRGRVRARVLVCYRTHAQPPYRVQPLLLYVGLCFKVYALELLFFGLSMDARAHLLCSCMVCGGHCPIRIPGMYAPGQPNRFAGATSDML